MQADTIIVKWTGKVCSDSGLPATTLISDLDPEIPCSDVRSVRLWTMRVASDRRFSFPAERASVWKALVDVPAYPTWWPWLTEFDGRLLADGETWSCGLRSPLRVVLQFRLRIDHIVEREHIAATISGDLNGTAWLTLTETDDGSEVHLVSALSPRSKAVSRIAAVAPPLASWAHDRVIDTAAHQFRRSLGPT